MTDKIKGTVKWFSNRKGFGFITPSSDNSPTTEDIFVHQSNIVTEAEYRTLKDGSEVEFEAITDDNGKLKAQNVTGVDGVPCPGPEPRERRQRKKKTKEDGSAESGDENGGDTGGEKSDDGGDDKEKKVRRRRKKPTKKLDAKPQPKSWYTDLDETVQESLESRGIKVDAGRAFIAIGDARFKLGTGGYAAVAHKSGILAEGTYTCATDGKIAVTWAHVLKFDSEWESSTPDAEAASLVTEIDLTDDSVTATAADETTDNLWGEGKADPKEALEKNEFQMRRIALVPTAGSGRRRGRGRRTNGKQNGEEQPAAASAEE